MTWLGVKLFFKKAWLALKTYWYIPLLLSWAVTAWFLLGRRSETITKVLYAAEKSYRDQVRILEDSHKEEISKRDKALERYLKTVQAMELELGKRKLELRDSEKERVRELAEEFKNKPDEYTKRIAEEFGFEYVE